MLRRSCKWRAVHICNLYNIKTTREELIARFRATDDWRNQVMVEKDYAAPGKPGYVVREQEGQRVLSTMLWGFPHQGKPVTNVRNYSSPFWRSALQNPERRCLVPVTEFQEWSAEAMPDTGKLRLSWRCSNDPRPSRAKYDGDM